MIFFHEIWWSPRTKPIERSCAKDVMERSLVCCLKKNAHTHSHTYNNSLRFRFGGFDVGAADIVPA